MKLHWNDVKHIEKSWRKSGLFGEAMYWWLTKHYLRAVAADRWS